MGSTQDVPMPAINLLRGWPAPSLLPTEIIRDAAQAALSSPSVAFAGLEYGPDPGYEPCREAIAKWLTTSFRNLPSGGNYAGSDAIGSEHICITGGASQNLANMLAVYTDPTYTRNVWIVAPAYMLAFRVFEDAGFGTKMRAVPDDQGIDLEYLRRELVESEAHASEKGMDKPLLKPGRKIFKHVIYCVPSFSNPTGMTMPLSTREGLVRLARDFDALVIPDDVYDFLHWPVNWNDSGEVPEYEPTAKSPAVRLPRLVDIDQSLDGGAERSTADGFGNVCSNGSFSKIVGPGVRVGWVQGSRKFIHGIASTGCTKSGGAPSQLTSTFITHMLLSGTLQDHIKTTLLPAYSKRYHAMAKALAEYLAELGFQTQQPSDFFGGYFVWVEIPSTLRDGDLVGECLRQANVIVASGKAFQVPGDTARNFNDYIRLCYAFEDIANFTEGIKRIAQVARSLLEGTDHRESQPLTSQDDAALDISK